MLVRVYRDCRPVSSLQNMQKLGIMKSLLHMQLEFLYIPRLVLIPIQYGPHGPLIVMIFILQWLQLNRVSWTQFRAVNYISDLQCEK